MDYDGTFNMANGTIIAVGSAGMAAPPSQISSQYSALIVFDSVLDAGTLVHIQASEGEDMLTFAPSKTFQSVVFSSPELIEGASYDVYYGGSSDGTESGGLYTDGTYTPGTLQDSFTVTDVVTIVGEMQGFGMPPGGEIPEDMTPPPDGEISEGMVPPPDSEMPEGMMTPPDGTTPEATPNG